MYNNQTPTKGQSWLLKVGSASLMIALLISSLGFVFSDASASAPPSSPANSSLPKFLAADSVIGDDTTAEFALGDLNSCSYVSETANGELILKPAAGAEFGGTTLPAGWVDAPWTAYQPDGSSTVSGGQLSVDESLFATTGYYTPGHVLDFVATFQQDVNQHAGWIDQNIGLNWAIFTLGSPAGNIIKARTYVEGSLTETDTAFTAGSPHHFRIVWTDTQVIYYVDDMVNPVATHGAAFIANLRPGFSDLTPDGVTVDHTKKLVVEWARMSPYTTPCTFTSRVLDAGAAANWKTLSWTNDLPAGTSLALSYQFGNSASPDSTWSSFINVPTSGTALTGRARYARYQVVLSTSDPALTPEVQKVQFTYNTDADTSAPAILSRSPASGATGVSRNTDVTVTFSKLLNAATVNGTSVFLREFGAGVDVPASVSLSAGNLITLNPTATLKQGAVYTVTIKASVADLGNTLLGTDAVWNFTTTSSAIDTTTVDFQGGTGCYVADTSGGEVILAPTLGAEFRGSALPAGWTGTAWGAGDSTLVGSGVVSVEKARVYYSAGSFTPGHSLEFVATFTTGQWQNVGWAADSEFNTSWAFFSTKDLLMSSTDLYARTSDGTDTLIAGNYIGSPHRYRIDWTATDVTFYVDGVQKAQHTVTFAENMFPIASDNTVDGQTVQVDWMRMSPYTSPCTFTSRVMDAGASVLWNGLSWVGSGTTIALSYRSGNSGSPDGTWTGFIAAPSSPATLNVTSRYIQYQAALSTADLKITPALESVTLTSLPVNYAPVITGQAALSTPEDTALTILLTNLTVTDVNNTYPAGFTLTVLDGTNYTHVGSTITPALNYNGPLTVPVKVNDGQADSNTFNLTVTVTPVNDPPVITAQAATLSTPEDTALTILVSNLTITDPDNTTFTLTVLDGTNYTHVGSTITPALNYNGSLTVPVKVNDGQADSNTFNLTVTVTAVNDAPVITAQATLSTPEDTSLTILVSNLTITDPDNTTFTLTVLDGTNYTHVGNTITPPLNFNGPLTVPVKVNDGLVDSNTFNLTVTVTPVNDAPVITAQATLSTPEDTALTILVSNLTITDPDNTTFTLTVLDGTNYTHVGSTITPALNYNGPLTVPVKVNDGLADSNTFNLTVTVNAVNDPPVITAQAGPLSTPEDTPLTILLSNLTVTDVDSATFTLTVLDGTNYTHVGSTITPALNYNGDLSVPVKVNDGLADSNTFNLTVTVTAVNDPPVITAQAATLSTPEETALTITLGDLTVTDPDSASFTLTVLDGTNYTHVGSTITPALNFNGDLSVPVKVNDGLADSNTFNLTVTVTPLNDPPVITEGTSVDVGMSVNGLPAPFNLTLHATDPDAGDTLTWSILTQATHGAASASGTGASQAIAYTPDTDYAGADSFVVQVSDGKGGLDSITVNVNIGVVTLTISGNAGLPGVTITYAGGSTTTDSQGDYTFTVAYGWSGTITPSLAGYVFTPASTDLTNVTADQSGVNFTAKATNYPVFLPMIFKN